MSCKLSCKATSYKARFNAAALDPGEREAVERKPAGLLQLVTCNL